MALELRPEWCVDKNTVDDVLTLGEWVDESGRPIDQYDGDVWSPGKALHLIRPVRLEIDPRDLRKHLGLYPGIELGIAVRWSCANSNLAGTHEGGPLPLPIAEQLKLELQIPGSVSRALVLETHLVVLRSPAQNAQLLPSGTIIWSEQWDVAKRDRSVVLEGDELRVPVRTVDFVEHYELGSESLWSIDLDRLVGMDDPLPNLVTVLLNQRVLERDFRDESGLPDASLLPAFVITGINVDLIHALTIRFKRDLEESPSTHWSDYPVGSVGAVLVGSLLEAFGSIEAALGDLDNEPAAFMRKARSVLAPKSWSN